jgi:hypothetical protein
VYAVRISNRVGEVVSVDAPLRVLVPPAIVTQPQGQVAAAGATVSFTVVVAGTGPFSYEWRVNGQALAGAAGPSLTLSNLKPEQAGSYRVSVTSLQGSVLSDPARLRVTVP